MTLFILAKTKRKTTMIDPLIVAFIITGVVFVLGLISCHIEDSPNEGETYLNSFDSY